MLPALWTVDDRASLVREVPTLSAPGALPGAMVASKAAFVVMASGDKPVVVAGPVGAGRVVAAGHEAYFGAGPLRERSNARFLDNALGWLGGRAARLRVGVLDMPGIAAKVDGTVTLGLKDLGAPLVGIDVLAMTQGALDGSPKAQSAVVEWVKAGHGLLIVGPAWGWRQLNPAKSLRKDHAGNRMLLAFGIGFSDETVDGAPTPADDPLLQTDSALAALRRGEASPRATGTVNRALALSPLDAGLAAEIDRLAAGEGVPLGPSRAQPFTEKTPFSRLRATLQARAWEESPAEAVRMHPSAAAFPGLVPAAAKRVRRTVTIDVSVPQWHGTGLYAAPGEVVTVRVPPSAANGSLALRVGSHTDELWHLDKWERFPAIGRAWPLRDATTRVASPFGGTVFVDVLRGVGTGKVEVTIEGAVPAPRFVRGETTSAEWARQMAETGGPWVELEGHEVALSVPRDACADLKEPEALMAFWDETFDRARELYAAPARGRPERYCVDRQISAGYMHSGYPIMTFEDVAKTFTDVGKLRGKGATWGFFHELGHNFQEGAWTFDGTGEVTNNLFSLYGSEKLNGITPAEYGVAHPAMTPEAQRRRLASYLAKGAPFAAWKSDPFLALTMDVQLREAFGWAPFTRVFGEYGRLGLAPRGETAQHDEWMTRMSRATGRDLGPFFQAWGVPTSDAARASLKDLPTWMPADWPAR